jgi:hypothetical protein
MNRRFALLSLVALALGCGEHPTSSSPRAVAPGHLTLRGGKDFEASGAPTFKDKAVVPATFAVAILDSVGGPYILAFNARGTGTGDFFVLSLTTNRTGTFGPCADGPSTTYPDGSILTLAGPCQSRFMEDVAAAGMVFRSRSFLQSVGGTVTVESAGERLVGSVANLRLAGTRADSANGGGLTITSGEFDLPLLRGREAHAISTCFLTAAVGGRCD